MKTARGCAAPLHPPPSSFSHLTHRAFRRRQWRRCGHVGSAGVEPPATPCACAAANAQTPPGPQCADQPDMRAPPRQPPPPATPPIAAPCHRRLHRPTYAVPVSGTTPTARPSSNNATHHTRWAHPARLRTCCPECELIRPGKDTRHHQPPPGPPTGTPIVAWPPPPHKPSRPRPRPPRGIPGIRLSQAPLAAASVAVAPIKSDHYRRPATVDRRSPATALFGAQPPATAVPAPRSAPTRSCCS